LPPHVRRIFPAEDVSTAGSYSLVMMVRRMTIMIFQENGKSQKLVNLDAMKLQ
jgi:hypothetical protein